MPQQFIPMCELLRCAREFSDGQCAYARIAFEYAFDFDCEVMVWQWMVTIIESY